jgi:hypothetical protein
MSSHASFSLSPEPQLPNQPFYGWLRSEIMQYASQIITFIAAMCSFIYYMGGAYDHTSKITPDTIQSVVLYLNLFFIAGFILVILHVLDENDSGHDNVKRAYERIFHLTKDEEKHPEKELKDGVVQLGQFKYYFLGFWISTLALYVSFIYKGQLSDTFGYADRNTLLKLFLPLVLNTIALLYIFKCFIVLYIPSRYTQFKNPKILNNLSTIAIVSVVVVFTGWVIIGPYHHEWMGDKNLRHLLQYSDAVGEH